jgi:hypothetical protein
MEVMEVMLEHREILLPALVQLLVPEVPEVPEVQHLLEALQVIILDSLIMQSL